MDEDLRRLRRIYNASNDPNDGLTYVSALFKSGFFDPQIRIQMGYKYPGGTVTVMNIHSIEHEVACYGGDYEIIYGAWCPSNNIVVIITVIKKYFDIEDPPRPRIREHMSSSELYAYDKAWQDYYDQERGELDVYVHQFLLDESILGGQVPSQYKSHSFGITSSSQHLIKNSMQLSNIPSCAAGWLSFIDQDIDFQDELEPLDDEEPELLTGRCEDYPACGHDICPRRWSTGEQADMMCVCGASIPIHSRWSLCESCLRAPDPDDPYGYDDGWYDEPPPDYCTECGCHAEDCPECEGCGEQIHFCVCENEDPGYSGPEYHIPDM